MSYITGLKFLLILKQSVCNNEHWITNGNMKTCKPLPGKSLLFCLRKTKKKGRGVGGRPFLQIVSIPNCTPHTFTWTFQCSCGFCLGLLAAWTEQFNVSTEVILAGSHVSQSLTAPLNLSMSWITFSPTLEHKDQIEHICILELIITWSFYWDRKMLFHSESLVAWNWQQNYFFQVWAAAVQVILRPCQRQSLTGLYWI